MPQYWMNNINEHTSHKFHCVAFKIQACHEYQMVVHHHWILSVVSTFICQLLLWQTTVINHIPSMCMTAFCFSPWCLRLWWSRIAGGCLWPGRPPRSISCSSRSSYLLWTPGPLLKTMSAGREREESHIYPGQLNGKHISTAILS